MPQQQQQIDTSDFYKVLGQQPAPQAVDTSDFYKVLGTQQPQQEGWLDWFARNAGLAKDIAGQALSDAGAAGVEIVREGLKGNFTPLREAAEISARGLGSTLALAAYAPGEFANQTLAIQEETQKQAQRRAASGSPYWLGSQAENARLQALEAQDPALSSRILRGVISGGIQALPAVGAGIVTGGSVPVALATGALTSLNQPENLVQSAILNAIPGVGAGRALGRGAIRGAEQAIGSEAAAIPEQFAGTQIKNMGAVAEQAALGARSVQSLKPGDILEYQLGFPPKTVRGEFVRGQVDPVTGQMVPIVKTGAGEFPAVEYLDTGRVVSPMSAAPLENYRMALSHAPELMEMAPEPFGVSLGKARPQLPGRVGPAIDRFGFVDDAIDNAASEIPKSKLQSILGNTLEGYRLQRSVLASGDLSAPFRQGLLLTLSPQQWINGNVPRATLRMFQSFSEKNFNRIGEEIAASRAAQVGEQFGLDLTGSGAEALAKSEEVFTSKLIGKIPLLRGSERAYVSYLNSLRVDRFAGYMKALENAGLSQKELERGLAAAADWVNDATGRGSFAKFGRIGKQIDRGMPILGEILFAPRNLASKLNILNPLTYARNLTSPGGRVVLRGQISDLMQFGAVLAGTYQLAKSAGAEVQLNPNSPDFLKMRWGTWRYDPWAGLQSLMRVIYKTGAAVNSLAHGETPKEGKDVVSILGHFMRGKAAPVPKFFIDYLTQKTYTGQPFDVKKAAIEQIAPLQWNDWLNAYLTEGWPGVAKATPGAFGLNVQNYAEAPGNVNLGTELNNELVRHGINATSIPQLPGDTEATQKLRAQKVEGWMNIYGSQLMNHPRYRMLNSDQQTSALQSLQKRVSSQANLKQPDIGGFAPMQVINSVLANEKDKPLRNQRLIVAPPK